MTTSGSFDHQHSRAIIIAAIIGVLGAIVAAFVGREVGESGAESHTARLEKRLEEQERVIHALEAQVANRDATTSTQDHGRVATDPPPLVIPPAAQLNASERAPVNVLRDRPIEPLAIERVAPFQISMHGCEHIGGGLTCSLEIENTSSESTNLALMSASTVIFVDGLECRLQDATLGSRRWSANAYGAIRIEAGIPLVAKLQFRNVPSSGTVGALRFVVAVVQNSEPLAVWYGPKPNWQSLLFKGVTLR